MSPTSDLRGKTAPSPDPRLTLARPDLADAALEGVVSAGHYVECARMQASAPVLAIRRAPEPDAEQVSQLLFGEAFRVADEGGGWAWGQCERDGYVGHVLMEGLSAPALRPTHRVAALRTYAFAAPSLKAAAVGLISLNALVTVEAEEGRWRRVARLGWIASEHLAPMGCDFETDPAGVALRFLGAPYLWGGRESLGLDCSGLIQQAFHACGLACPRDSDMQAALGSPVPRAELRRNDLVFWKGHVGIMLDAGQLLHANAYHLATAVERLDEAVARIEASANGAPTGYRRIPNLSSRP